MSNHVTTRTQEEIAALFTQDLVTGVGRSVKHDSAPKHVSGEAVYVDDRLEFPNQLHIYARMSERAHARIVRVAIFVVPCCVHASVCQLRKNADSHFLRRERDEVAWMPWEPSQIQRT